MNGNNFFKQFWMEHSGKIVGLCSGLLFALLVITLGFRRAIFLILCLLAGLYLGSLIDKDVRIGCELKHLFGRLKRLFKGNS